MVRKSVLKLRVTALQRTIIEENANQDGYVFLSDYLRDTALKSNKDILEIKRMLQKILEAIS